MIPIKRPSIGPRVISLLGLALVSVLAACSGTGPTPHRPHHVPAAARPSAASLLTGGACLALLDQLGVSYRVAPPPLDPHPCGVDTPIRVSSVEMAHLNRPVLMGCGVADTLARWETEVVEPAARRYLGQHITGMTSYGAYYCRQEVGSSRNYVSMHAYGLAIDVAGWKLADGSEITVAKDWDQHGPAGEFLQIVSEGACRYFSVVLTPEANAAHHDHFHLDIGPYRYCGRGRE